MKLKSKILYFFLLLSGFGGLAVWCAFTAIAALKIVAWYVFFPLLIVGLAASLYLGVIFHEVGHLVFGLIGGMKFRSLRVPFLCITDTGRGVKVSLKEKSSFLGSCEMFPTDRLPPSRGFVLEAFGGPAGSFAAMLISVLFLALAPYISVYPVILFGFAAPFLYVILLENSFPATVGGARTDGGQICELLKKTPSSKVLVSVLSVQAHYSAGKRPREIPYELLFEVPQIEDTDPNYALLLNNRYLYALDRGDLNALKDAHMRIRDVLPRLPDVYAEQLSCDIFYDSLFLFPDDAFVKANCKAVFRRLDEDDDINSCRIRGYYYLRAGALDKAFAEIEKGRNVAGSYPLAGIAKTELDLLDELDAAIARSSVNGEE